MKIWDWKSFLKHLALFLVVEIIFVFILFREFPPFSLLTLTGILHTSYWFIVLLAGWIRERYADRVWKRFLSTYLPLVYHVIIHFYIGIESIYELSWDHTHEQESLLLITIATLAAWVLIALGEYWLYRTNHCVTHHHKTHVHCHDEKCIDEH